MRQLKNDLVHGMRSLAPAHFPYPRFLLALAVGALGGGIFLYLHLPLAWMLGSMSACTIAVLLGARIEAPAVVRPPMIMIVGVILGTGFSPGVISQVASWIVPIAGLVVSVVLCGLACVTYFRIVAGFDLKTAYFAGMPGGLVEMMVLGEQRGADIQSIALVHSARILLVLLALPFAIQLATGVRLGTLPQASASISMAPWQSLLFLLGTGIAGVAVGHILRLRAKYLLGPLTVSAALHISGISSFVPPIELLNVAQLVLGTSIGCRFATTPRRSVLRLLAISVGATAIMLSIATLVAYVVSHISLFSMMSLLLAYSPGGLTEMSIIAISLQTEVAFVAAHHIIRVTFVTIGAALLFRLLPLRRNAKADET